MSDLDTEAKPTKPTKSRNPFRLQTLKDEKDRRQKKRARIVIKNISFKVTDELLRNHFEKWGKLEDVNLLKRDDGKLVGCAFIQYETINQATKAIYKANNTTFLGRTISVNWALGKNFFTAQKGAGANEIPKVEEIKEEDMNVDDDITDIKDESDIKEESVVKSEEDSDDDGSDHETADGDNDDDDDDSKDKSKLDIEHVKKEKHISNDVQEGCTIFIKNIPFDIDEKELRKTMRTYGLISYVIINREPISGHSKGTAFIKFKTKDSADVCIQQANDIILHDQLLEVLPALSRDEMKNQAKNKTKDKKDSRNLYLAREGLVMSGSKAAAGVSAADMAKRHQLEQVKTQVLKNLNRFVSRNRLSIHNLPISYDNDKLKQMIITYTNLRPHECRVMRENKITPEHPQGKSKGFGFMSFNTHQDAIIALRKLNNNPKIFGEQHRPIVAFSIEDRAVHAIKEKRKEKSKLNNPTFKKKLEKRKELRKLKVAGKLKQKLKGPQSDDKENLRKHLKKLEETRAAKSNPKPTTTNKRNDDTAESNYVGTTAKPGASIGMRSNKKIKEQAKEHLKRVKTIKRKEKQRKIKQIHLAERKQTDRTKQNRKTEYGDIAHLITKYKNIINKNTNAVNDKANETKKVKKPKRTKWYAE